MKSAPGQILEADDAGEVGAEAVAGLRVQWVTGLSILSFVESSSGFENFDHPYHIHAIKLFVRLLLSFLQALTPAVLDVYLP
jgi:hypothetical protein